MNRRWLAALVAAALMITANAFEASALGSQSDDWLNFDQSGDSRGQTSRGQALAPEVEVQPEQGFPTQENVTPAKNAIKQYAEIVARGGWAAQPSGGFVGGIGDSLGFAQGGEVRQQRNDGGWVTETLPYDKWDTRTVPSFPSGGISRPIDIPRVSFASSDTFRSGYQSNPPASFAEGGQVRKYRDDGGWVTSSLGTVHPNWNWQPSVMYRAASPHVSQSQPLPGSPSHGRKTLEPQIAGGTAKLEGDAGDFAATRGYHGFRPAPRILRETKAQANKVAHADPL